MTSAAAGVTLRAAEPGDGEAVRALVGSVMGWGPDRQAERMWRWKHEENPFGRSPTWVAEDRGRIVAVRTFLRWDFVLQRRRLRCVRAVDTVTHPDHRGQGLFRSLTLHAIEALQVDGVDFVFNTPNDQSRPGYLSMGWQDVGRLDVSVWGDGAGGWLSAATNRRPSELLGLPATAGVDVETGVAMAGGAVDRWTGAGLHTRKDRAYLLWRYARLPELGYRMLFLDDDQPEVGCVVYRLKRRGRAVEAVISECWAPRRGARIALARALVRRTGAAYALALPGPLGAPGLRLRGRGPRLTARALVVALPTARELTSLSYGDVELF